MSMVRAVRLYAAEDDCARFEDIEIPFPSGDPPPGSTSLSQPMPAAAVLFARAPAGSHGEQPESQRQLAVGVSGTVEITASGEARTFGPGDVLLIEDTEGVGHSSRTSGFTAAVIVLDS